MKRISNEDVASAGARNVGRFFLAAIPLALGLGAMTWFGLWVSGYEFQQRKDAAQHELNQQERSAVYVGAAVKPKDKLTVEIISKSCLNVVRADVDTKKRGYPYDDSDYVYSLMLYVQSKCKPLPDTASYYEKALAKITYAAYHWESVSPNGTILKSGYTNQCPIPSLGEIAECQITIERDERIDKLRAWATTE